MADSSAMAVPSATPSAGRGGLLDVALVLAAVATIELLALRVGTRTLIHIPGIDRVDGAFAVLADLGRVAYSFSVVLLVMVLLGIAVAAARARAIPALVSVLLFGLAAAAARVGLVEPSWITWVGVVAVIVLGSAVLRRHPLLRERAGARVPLLLIGVSIVLFGVRAVTAVSAGAAAVEGVGWLLAGAEVTAVVGLALLPLVVGRPDRVAALAAVVIGLAVWASLTFSTATSTTLLLWNLGLAGVVPASAFGLAAAGATAATVTAARRQRPEVVVAIVLLFAGGFAIQNTYQSALLVAAAGTMAFAASARPCERDGYSISFEQARDRPRDRPPPGAPPTAA